MKSISDCMDEYFNDLEKRQNEYWNNKGKCLGYSNECCLNCGRVRVIMYENGDGICEKCNWNRRINNYEEPPIY